MNTKKLRVAILIADSHDEFYQNIKKQIHPKIWSQFKENQIDIFYAIGKKTEMKSLILNMVIERIRWSKIRYFQYHFDRRTLSRYLEDQPEQKLLGDSIYIPIPEGLRFLTFKIYHSLVFLKNMGYDVVFRTTISSIVNYQEFMQIIRDIDPNEILYSGKIVEHLEIKFVSGASTLISAKAIQALERNKSRIDFGYLDDVAFGCVLQAFADDSRISSRNIGSLQELNSLSSSDLNSTLHFRCRSIENSRNDLEIMQALWVKLS
jgi:hypothetical protein